MSGFSDDSSHGITPLWRDPRLLWWALPAWLAVLGAAAWLLFDPYPQPEAYHRFADTRPWLGLPNFGDVASNAALLLAGLGGLLWLRVYRRSIPGGRALTGPVVAEPWEAACYLGFFAALALTALGSAYYHWAPDTPRLFWDRLPLSLVPMLLPPALLARASATTRGPQSGSLRGPLRLFTAGWIWLPAGTWLAAGPASVVAWSLGEAAGRGDLRAYAVTQAAALTATALLLPILQTPRRELRWFLAAFLLYALAKLAEHFDAALFAWSGLVSGHTLKHLLAALAAAMLLSLLAGRAKPRGAA